MTPITPVIPGLKLPIVTFAEDQPEYFALPCHKDPDGMVTIRWKLTWRERFEVLFGGCIWQTVLTFNDDLQPIKLETRCPRFPTDPGPDMDAVE